MKNIVFVSIIDDEEIIRSLLLKILKTIEIEQVELDVAAFEGGIPFFESKRAEDSRNHLIILDGIMPAMDGMEILQKVKKTNNNGSNISVLMLSGRKSESYVQRALMLGADDYVTKPFGIQELKERIRRLLIRMN
ncbi:response regulator transcription factor [Neobacillus cucumis]|uniref:response regulator transcription factor n=1 Tax=Neobacillus cucumis TaxID=1740721 RepID=UPI0018E048D6|nr:response regulator [Neobacillus cucumis]MBI0580213.1 response regulator transcription factor [Neobacillus cucumis]